MLTQGEEEVLKRLARDNAPSVVVNPQTAPLPSETETTHIGRLLRSWTKPLAVVAGPMPKPVNGVARAAAGEDAELLRLTDGLRLKGEVLMAFFARTQVSAHQVRTLTRRELKRLIEVKAANRDDVTEPRRAPIPNRLEATFGAGPEFEPNEAAAIQRAAIVGGAVLVG